MIQHRLVVCASVIEQDFHSSQIIDGKRCACNRLLYQMARIFGAKCTFAKDARLNALGGIRRDSIENITRDIDVAVLDDHAWKFGKELDQFVKHAMDQHGSNGRYSKAGKRKVEKSAPGPETGARQR